MQRLLLIFESVSALSGLDRKPRAKTIRGARNVERLLVRPQIAAL